MVLALIFALQQPVAPPPPPASVRPASPIARVQVDPGDVAVQAGDTVRLRAVAYDSGGQAIPGATTRWFQASHGFEGRVSDDGLVTAGSTGAMKIAAVTSVAGSRPTTTFTRITILPPPAARIAVEPTVKRLYVGQSLSLSAVPYAANNDRRYDPIAWESDAPGVVSVTPAGRITAVRAGRVTVTARAGRASQAIPLVVDANQTAAMALTPGDTAVRTGDVVRLRVSARTSGGKLVPDVMPEFLVSPGGGAVDPDGAFVACEPGTYRIVASFAGRTAEATVTARPRDAARPTTVVGRLPVSGFISTEFCLHPDGRH